MDLMRYAWVGDTLLGTNISPEKSILKGSLEGIYVKAFCIY